LRAGLLVSEESDAVVLFRAVILGVLHGPITKVGSYLSNQMQRTFSPKPAYAVKFWAARDLLPPKVNVLTAIGRKVRRIQAGRYLSTELQSVCLFHRYRRDVLGMDEAEARAEMEQVWRPNGVWATFVGR